MSKPIFYVYILFDWHGVPFYVGKGKDDRWLVHERKTDLCNNDKNEIIEQTWTILGEVPKIKIADNLTEKEALELEVLFIKTIGRKDLKEGPLLNLTEGGDGTSGYVYPDWLRKVRSEQFKALRAKEGFEVLSKRSKAILARTKEKRSAISKAIMIAIPLEERRARGIRSNAKLTPEQRSARAYKREAAFTPEFKRQRALNAIAKFTPEQLSERAKKIQENRTAEERKQSALKGVITRKNGLNPNYKPRKGKNKLCKHCNKEFYVKASWADITFYCSNICRLAALRAKSAARILSSE